MTPTVRAVQGSIPIARVNVVQSEKSEALELIRNDNNCVLTPDPTKNILEDLSLLFVDCKSVDEEMIQFGGYSRGVVRLAEHGDNASKGGSCCYSAEAIDGIKMDASGRVSARKRRFRSRTALISSRVMKSEDYG